MLQNISISTDKEKLDISYIHQYLSVQSYWAQGRTKNEMKTIIANSMCFGLFHENKQVGFARVVTDYIVFAYLADVFVDEKYRGKGLSKLLLSEIIANPALQQVKKWLLATRDAHGLYTQFGFKPLTEPEKMMEMKAKE